MSKLSKLACKASHSIDDALAAPARLTQFCSSYFEVRSLKVCYIDCRMNTALGSSIEVLDHGRP